MYADSPVKPSNNMPEQVHTDGHEHMDPEDISEQVYGEWFNCLIMEPAESMLEQVL